MLTAYISSVTDNEGLLAPKKVSESLRMPVSQLAKLIHVHRNTLAKNPASPHVQNRLGEMVKIIATASGLLGEDIPRAISWFRHQPLSGFEGQTAEQLVSEGHGEAVLAHLETLRDGVYA